MTGQPLTNPDAASVDTIGYRRVSTEDQARGEKASLPQQQEAIAALAQRLGRQLGPVFEDPGVSGATAEQRPGFQAMLRYCEAHPRTRRAPGYVLVLNDSRWGRFPNPEEAAYWRIHLEKRGWLVRFAEGGEVQDPSAAFLLRSVHTMQATAYREAIRANAKRGARGAAARGLWQNEAPIGYRRLATGGGKPDQVLEPGQRKASDQAVRLTPGPEDEQAFVRWCFARYAAGGISLGALAREGHRRLPVRQWSRVGMGKILKNRAYLGEVVWCRRPHDDREREETPVRPERDWVVTPNAHPPLVTPELFAAVARRMGANQKQTSATAGGYPLSGLIHCVHCGEPYTGGGGRRGPAGDPDRYRFYKDRGGTKWYDGRLAAICAGPMGTLPKRWVERQVVDAVARVVEEPAVQAEVAHALDRLLASTRDDARDHEQAARARRRALEQSRDRLIRAISRGTLEEAEAAPELERIRQELAAITDQADRTRFATRRASGLAIERDRLLALARDFRAIADRLAGHELRELLQPWIEEAVVDKRKRVLLLTIRHVPALSVLQSDPGAGPGCGVENIRIRLPGRGGPRRRRVA
jgi:DNA invertase Pin-like site-specific DNA recombinase